MKFDIFNRFSGKVQFTAEIYCDDGASRSVKVGLAVKWAVKSGANMSGADMSGANMSYANMSGADMSGADMSGANMSGADMSGANMSYANMSGADMSGADMSGADMSDADMSGANMSGANMSDANMSYADMSGADMSDADMSGANGINDFIKCIQLETYTITYTSDIIQIGCERHTHKEWREFSDREILEMDKKPALVFWRKYKNWIFQTIELCPAKQMNFEVAA